MDIKPASLAQVQRSRTGKLIQIDDDVLGIAQQLHEIDENLHLRYSEAGEYFVIFHTDPETKTEHFVLSSVDLNPQIVERIRQISSNSYDFVKEIEKQEAQAERDNDHRIREQSGDIAERFFHARRKDLGITSKIFVPAGFDRGPEL